MKVYQKLLYDYHYYYVFTFMQIFFFSCFRFLSQSYAKLFWTAHDKSFYIICCYLPAIHEYKIVFKYLLTVIVVSYASKKNRNSVTQSHNWFLTDLIVLLEYFVFCRLLYIVFALCAALREIKNKYNKINSPKSQTSLHSPCMWHQHKIYPIPIKFRLKRGITATSAIVVRHWRTRW